MWKGPIFGPKSGLGKSLLVSTRARGLNFGLTLEFHPSFVYVRCKALVSVRFYLSYDFNEKLHYHVTGSIYIQYTPTALGLKSAFTLTW